MHLTHVHVHYTYMYIITWKASSQAPIYTHALVKKQGAVMFALHMLHLIWRYVGNLLIVISLYIVSLFDWFVIQVWLYFVLFLSLVLPLCICIVGAGRLALPSWSISLTFQSSNIVWEYSWEAVLDVYFSFWRGEFLWHIQKKQLFTLCLLRTKRLNPGVYLCNTQSLFSTSAVSLPSTLQNPFALSKMTFTCVKKGHVERFQKGRKSACI